MGIHSKRQAGGITKQLRRTGNVKREFQAVWVVPFSELVIESRFNAVISEKTKSN